MRWVLELDEKPAGPLALEVGIGVGGVANHASRDAEVVGMDLGHGVDVAARTFGANPFLHVVQASAFQPPLRPATFDLVYSFGVLHHTYSTRDAFTSLATLPRPGGRFYVWVYSPHDEQRNLVRRALMATEKIIRPIVWRLPGRLQTAAILPLVPAYMAWQRVQALRGDGRIAYGFREALHAARDRFTPRYIHRHTDEELESWFRAAGYERLQTTSARPKPDWVPIAFTACAGVSGFRA